MNSSEIYDIVPVSDVDIADRILVNNVWNLKPTLQSPHPFFHSCFPFMRRPITSRAVSLIAQIWQIQWWGGKGLTMMSHIWATSTEWAKQREISLDSSGNGFFGRIMKHIRKKVPKMACTTSSSRRDRCEDKTELGGCQELYISF